MSVLSSATSFARKDDSRGHPPKSSFLVMRKARAGAIVYSPQEEKPMRLVNPILCVLAIVATGGVRSFAQAPASSPQPAAQPNMERVTGIGGFFFRASDPKTLAEWYERHLGVT